MEKYKRFSDTTVILGNSGRRSIARKYVDVAAIKVTA